MFNMKCLMFALLIPTLCLSQSKVFVSPSIQYEHLESRTDGGSFRLAVGGKMGSSGFVGGGVGYTKLNGLTGIIPIFFHAGYSGKGKIAPAVVMQPGYGIYSGSHGGFTAYLGAGVAVRGKKTITQLLAGYSTYGFTVLNTTTDISGLGIRFALIGL